MSFDDDVSEGGGEDDDYSPRGASSGTKRSRGRPKKGEQSPETRTRGRPRKNYTVMAGESG